MLRSQMTAGLNVSESTHGVRPTERRPEPREQGARRAPSPAAGGHDLTLEAELTASKDELSHVLLSLRDERLKLTPLTGVFVFVQDEG